MRGRGQDRVGAVVGVGPCLSCCHGWRGAAAQREWLSICSPCTRAGAIQVGCAVRDAVGWWEWMRCEAQRGKCAAEAVRCALLAACCFSKPPPLSLAASSPPVGRLPAFEPHQKRAETRRMPSRRGAGRQVASAPWRLHLSLGRAVYAAADATLTGQVAFTPSPRLDRQSFIAPIKHITTSRVQRSRAAEPRSFALPCNGLISAAL
ncbi:hypothetical protein L1887_57036 [Cichorium endivia]|nr:hypothetical protein L1887_57036 [Cichorium endivia]